MPKHGIDLTGQRFGRLLVVSRAVANKSYARQNTWNCLCDCGESRSIVGQSLRSGVTVSCGCFRREASRARLGHSEHTGANNPMWKGGKAMTKSGYVLVYAPSHPRARRNKVREHILVMEAQLGRFLLPGETVHHRNGIRHDNTPSNLELWRKAHGPGQRVSDLVDFALEILKTYAPAKLLEFGQLPLPVPAWPATQLID